MATTSDREQNKEDLIGFYRSETSARDSQEWIEAGGSVRVPESRSAIYFVDRKVKESVEMAGAGPDASIIEVGCSFGQMSFPLGERFRKVTAVDLSADCIDLASRRGAHYGVTNVSFQRADAETLEPFADNSFDAAFSYSVLRYIPDPEQGLRQIHRVLKPGGVAVVDFPNRYCPWFGPMKSLLGIRPHIHDRLFSASEVVAMMERAGFTDIGYRHILFTTRRLPVKLLPPFKVADAILERIPLVNRLAAIIMVRGRKHGKG